MNALSFIIVATVFVLLPLMFGILQIKDYFTCNTSIKAVYTGYIQQNIKEVVACYPKFEYEYNNKKYSAHARECFSVAEIMKKYKEGDEYEILINSKQPDICIITRSMTTGILLILIAIGFGLLFFTSTGL